MARSYHQLGIVDQLRGRLEEAESWYKRALAIEEALGDQLGMVASYGQLGILAQDRGRLEEAEGWLKRALAISEFLRNQPHMAMSYHQLGMVAQDRGRLEEAESWYKRALERDEFRLVHSLHSEVVGALLGGEGAEELADGGADSLDGASGGLSQTGV